MIEETAIVKKIDPDPKYAWVETKRKSSCTSCSSQSSCGTQVLSKVLGKKTNSVRVLSTVNAQVGDEVSIAMDENSLLKGSFILYLIPLLFMLVSSLIANLIAQKLNVSVLETDIVSIIFAVIGFMAGMKIAGKMIEYSNLQPSSEYQAKIINIKK